MRLLCRHGHLAFFPRAASEIARFTQHWGITLVSSEDFYTFPALADAPDFSIKGKIYSGTLVALETFEGRPWDVMRENGFVYNINLEKLVLKETITSVVALPLMNYCFLAQSPVVQPGSRNAIGRQILSFDGEYDTATNVLKLSEFGNE